MTRKLPPLTALRAFEATARHLSMARAAAELHVTPAAVSQQIKLLEDSLGLTLFRRGKTLALSEGAQAALPLLSDAFDRLERAATLLRAGSAEGPLVVSSPPTFAARWLVPRLDDFQARHPDIQLRLLATRRLVDFDLEDVDLAIRFGTGDYPGLRAQRLMAETIVPVAAPALSRRIASLADLARTPLLNDEWHTRNQLFPDWETWLASQGHVPDAPLRIQTFGDINLSIQAAIAGLGVALAWHSLVADNLSDGSLVRLLDHALATRLAYHLVVPAGRALPAKVAAFQDWIMELGTADAPGFSASHVHPGPLGPGNP